MASLHVLYGPPIQEAIAAGDLPGMKQLAAEAEQHLSVWVDVRAALEHPDGQDGPTIDSLDSRGTVSNKDIQGIGTAALHLLGKGAA
jgi:hypothetical protein